MKIENLMKKTAVAAEIPDFGIKQKNGVIMAIEAAVQAVGELYSFDCWTGKPSKVGNPYRVAHADLVTLEAAIRREWYRRELKEAETLHAEVAEVLDALNGVALEYDPTEVQKAMENAHVLLERSDKIITALQPYASVKFCDNDTIQCIIAAIRNDGDIFPTVFTSAVDDVMKEIERLEKSTAQDIKTGELKRIVTEITACFWDTDEAVGLKEYTFGANGTLAKDVYRVTYKARMNTASGTIARRTKKNAHVVLTEITFAILEALQAKLKAEEAKDEDCKKKAVEAMKAAIEA